MSLESQKETIYSHQRVAITILDFDWVFEEDNTKKVLEILVNFGENKLFKQESIKSFIKLMWSYYQPAIIRKIFLPYCIYMTIMILLASKGVGEYLDTLESQHNHSAKDDSKATLSLLETVAKAVAGSAPSPPADPTKTPETPAEPEDDHAMPWLERIMIICASVVVGILWSQFFLVELA